MKLFKMSAVLFMFIMALSSVSFAETPERYYDIGMKLYNARNYSKALSYFTKAAKADKTNPEYFHMIGNCYEKMGQPAKAKPFINFAAKLAVTRSALEWKKIRVSPFAGFTTVGMETVNDFLFENLASDTAKTSKFGAGFTAGVEAGYSFLQGLYTGVKLGIILPANAKLTDEYSIPGMSSKMENQYSVLMIPVMLGGSYEFKIPNTPVSAGAGIYAGWGFASGSFISNTEQTITIMGITTKTDYKSDAAFSGGCFTADLSAFGEYKISDMISAGLNIGYRIATVSEMKYTKVPDGSPYENGDVVEYPVSGWTDTKPLPFNFGGFIITARASFYF
ncbi:MAG: hypothetical protein CVV21_00525 [Candidatus Goldiibacteriota bacterium HGW-Goldbacteria-1]|nr:MAG: hypothetical protein CVV21_00525 [Candidatus Goldiibacteriota bacterium HGW-Goldbacteria-1]